MLLFGAFEPRVDFPVERETCEFVRFFPRCTMNLCKAIVYKIGFNKLKVFITVIDPTGV
jgi:hypothetical protein